VVEKLKTRHHPALSFKDSAPAWRRVPEDDAMADDTKKRAEREAKVRWDQDTIEEAIRARIRQTIETVLEEELDAALGAAPSARVGEQRRGYRHGSRGRTLTTSVGPTHVDVPRARLQTDTGRAEWRSEILPRYQRRTARVDEAILGVYLAGGNSRRIRAALAPLLRGGPLSKDAVSRLVGRLAEDFAAWQTRDLADDQIRYLLLDGWYPKVRLGKRRVRVPVLVTMGVRADGERVVVDMRLVGDESTAAWRDVVQQLQRRHVGTPALAIIDGHAGLATALREAWPALAIQRCTAHKLRNLTAKAPVRQREEVAEDYRRVLYADTAALVQQRRAAFVKKWRLQCPAVAQSFEEAGDELFTFLRFPRSQWKALRTTNALERINEEFRRRTKTQASLPSQDAVLLLLFGLLRAGHIRMRKIDGWQEMQQVTAAAVAA
jgi:transposase-like protein